MESVSSMSHLWIMGKKLEKENTIFSQITSDPLYDKTTNFRKFRKLNTLEQFSSMSNEQGFSTLSKT